MQEKYEKLFYELKPDDIDLGSWTNKNQAFLHGEKDIPGAYMYAGFQMIYEPVKLEQEPIYHREEENLIFFGAKLPDVFSSWDAEIHVYLGPDLDHMEKVVVTDPTLIRVPKGWFHGPINVVRVGKPIYFQAVLFASRPGYFKKLTDGTVYFAEEETHRRKFDPENPGPKSAPWTVINEDGVGIYSETGTYDPNKAPNSRNTVITDEYKSQPYSDATPLLAPKPALTETVRPVVLAMPKEETQWGAWCPSPQAYFRGDMYMENANYNVGFQVFTMDNDMEAPHFHQGADEYIFFVGPNAENIFDFECEIHFFIGDDPQHMEEKIITKPTVVRLPPTVWHCPILFRNMKKPLVFQAAFLHGTWGTIIESKGESKSQFLGTKTYEYMGDNVRFCRFNPKKRCNICGACFPKPGEYKKEEEK
ncbi:MAG: hypothetical protein MJ067_05540 [Oscillospiraceae bacterium]|nr:hypothetical protein [Oscillospiraceae bacterium]